MNIKTLIFFYYYFYSITGTIYTEAPLDRELQSTHLLIAGVKDSGGKTDFTKVVIGVKDVNDNPPVFHMPQYQGNVAVGRAPGAVVLKVWDLLRENLTHILQKWLSGKGYNVIMYVFSGFSRRCR